MKIIKKNQLTILVLALMLVTAGYLNYTNTAPTVTEIASIGDATLVSANLSNSISEMQTIQEETKALNQQTELDTTVSTMEENKQEETTNTQQDSIENNSYFATTRLERDTMYSQMLESYQKILDSQTTSSKQKEASQKEIDIIHKTKNAIMITENLIKTKGIEDVVILVNDDSISVIIKKTELKKEDIAQVQSIIAREMNAKIEDIHIMNKN